MPRKPVTKNVTMTPLHPRWDEFTARLQGPEGCDFREVVKGEPASTQWDCKGGTDKTFARQILKRMCFSPAAVERSMAYFEAHGGYCDCEIVMNVEDSARAKGEMLPCSICGQLPANHNDRICRKEYES